MVPGRAWAEKIRGSHSALLMRLGVGCFLTLPVPKKHGQAPGARPGRLDKEGATGRLQRSGGATRARPKRRSACALVMTAAGSLPVEKRSVFLERVAARLLLRGTHFTDADPGVAIQTALAGLIQSAA
jgi:hypothetical protein